MSGASRSNRSGSNKDESKTQSDSSWKEEAQDLLRGATGGLIFGAPLLYTMEMWQQGITLGPAHVAVLLCAILAINFVFNLFSGLRKENENHHSLKEALADTVTAVGLSLLISALVLFLIDQLKFESGFTHAVGKIIVEALVISIGISFTNSRFEQAEGNENEVQSESSTADLEKRQARADLLEATGTLGGAVVFSMSVAPTEEILLIATSLSSPQLLLLFLAELLFCHLILSVSTLSRLEVHVKGSFFQHRYAETVMATALSLLVSAALIALLGYPGTTGGMSTFVACAISLGFPAVIGGAAGRIAV